ncbi:uncharacterized protein LOC135626527 isoform X2 [Musa acuminata AAA Group]|uniref:uncharacterized protein LOC135597412 isoform X2 n=1 Tax=Musa acuminata AAA Group TaxID=214697 RepID=UPI0031CFE493
MCIAAWAWQSHPTYQLLLLLNRDEFHDRPTKPVGWWGDGDGQTILGGRDELGGGTWMGCTRDGKVAFLTNFREPDPWSGSRSRGELPKRFLESTKCPSEFAEEIVKEADQYNGFNLIVADLCTKSMFYISNRPKGKPASLLEVLPGIHVLSNANLDSPWPKAERLRKGFSEVLASCRDEELCMKDIVKKLMCDKTKAERYMLPMTGCSPERELEVSSIFIETHREQGLYGTRNMGALSVKTSGEVSFYERYIENTNWKEHVFQYHVQQL